ncbi:hypothetical protein C7B77_02315 [Chamaesiphon polymorphus CCALA 037]|uniref:Uncharacterized protein n=1 Tax=Chamaesiphon polymorphus CCALA 037 TaxID=2107692 RepID=A0A2T1GMG0_9CYAN|nr:hypothetical protein C7B77_02315 [Chamaesiphon polymorphus CCALA 037]
MAWSLGLRIGAGGLSTQNASDTCTISKSLLGCKCKRYLQLLFLLYLDAEPNVQIRGWGLAVRDEGKLTSTV